MSNKLTKEQIESNVAAYRHALETGSIAGIEVSYGPDGSKKIWVAKDSMAFHIADHIRIRPTPKLRPWKREEIPLDSWFREAEFNDEWFKIASIWDGSIGGEKVTFIEFTDHDKGRATLDEMGKNYQHSTDNGKTWLPCGVEE